MSETKTQAESPATGRQVVGRVISNKMQKTISVMVERQIVHPMYGKRLRRSTVLKAHDEKSECREGDLVSIRECRPISSSKHWMLVQVLEKAAAPVAEVAAGV